MTRRTLLPAAWLRPSYWLGLIALTVAAAVASASGSAAGVVAAVVTAVVHGWVSESRARRRVGVGR